MLTPNQQKIVWEGWLSAEVRAYYFADLALRYQRRQTVVTWLLLASATTGWATLVADWLPAGLAWVRPVLAFATAGLSLWSALARNQKNVTDCADLHFRWHALATRFEELWDQMYEPHAARTLQALKATAAEISKSSVVGALPYDAVRMGKWQDLVEAQHAPALSA